MKKNGLFRKYNHISIEYFYTDKHVHSRWGDGHNSIKQIVKKAAALGLNQIAITEHIRENSVYFPAFIKEIKSIKKEYPLEVLIGFEAKIKNFKGEIDIPAKALEQAQLRIASVHRFPIGNGLYRPGQFEKKVCQRIELDLSLAALKRQDCNVLGHPGGMSLLAYREFPLGFFEMIIAECKNKGIAFELNSAYHADIYAQLKPLLRRHNPLVSVGSDAHKIHDICGWPKILEHKCKK